MPRAMTNLHISANFEDFYDHPFITYGAFNISEGLVTSILLNTSSFDLEMALYLFVAIYFSSYNCGPVRRTDGWSAVHNAATHERGCITNEVNTSSGSQAVLCTQSVSYTHLTLPTKRIV